MPYKSIRRIGITNASEIRQPPRPRPMVRSSTSQLRPYYLNDSKLSIIAEHSRLKGGCELEEVTSMQNLPTIQCLTLVVVSYGTDANRFRACQRALERLDRADPKPGRKIFLEAGSTKFEYLQSSGWEYHHYDMNDRMSGLFQKEPLWTIGTQLAFADQCTDDVVLIDADCAFHDNSWAYLIHKSLVQYAFVQPYAAIFYSEQKDRGMDTGTIPTIAYCMNTHQEHSYAVPGGAYACTRYFFEHILHNNWPINPVGSGDIKFWQYLYGSVPITNNKTIKNLEPIGRYHSFEVGYTSLLVNHYYHGPMSNRMYDTRAYISSHCCNGTETILNQNGLLEWSTNTYGKIMQKSMTELKKNVDSYNQVGRRFTIDDTKAMFKRISKDELGKIDQNNKLVIVTSYREYGIHSKNRINELRDAVKRTFKCPYTFKVATNDPNWNPSEMIYCDIPSYLIPIGYEWIMAASIEVPSNTSVLYLDPDARLVGECDMIPASDQEVYLARNDRVWSTKIIYFRSLFSLYAEFKNDIRHKEYEPGRLYPDPASYFIHALTELTAYNLRDVLFHIDYESKGKELAKTTNVVI